MTGCRADTFLRDVRSADPPSCVHPPRFSLLPRYLRERRAGMTPMSSSPSVDRTVRAPGDGRWTPRLVLLLVALAWPTQLLAAGGILGANAIAGVAQAFHTTQVAWFGLTLTLVSVLLTPFVIK